MVNEARLWQLARRIVTGEITDEERKECERLKSEQSMQEHTQCRSVMRVVNIVTIVALVLLIVFAFFIAIMMGWTRS